MIIGSKSIKRNRFSNKKFKIAVFSNTALGIYAKGEFNHDDKCMILYLQKRRK